MDTARPRRLRGGRVGDRARALRVGDAVAALSQLQRALALLAADLDPDLRDLRAGCAGLAAGRRRCLGRRRAPPRPPCVPGDPDGVQRPVRVRRFRGMALRRTRRAGPRDRRRAQRGERGSARPTPAPRPGRRRPHERNRIRDRPRPRHPGLVVARAARIGAPDTALRRPARPVLADRGRSVPDARAGRRAQAVAPDDRAPERARSSPPPVPAGRTGRALVMVDRCPLLLAGATTVGRALRDQQRDRGRERHRPAHRGGGGRTGADGPHRPPGSLPVPGRSPSRPEWGSS